jgi:DNA-directed RNA polymerase subunit RPC12/RpoP
VNIISEYNESRAMPEWECERCGAVHDSNPTKCEECGCSILIQHRPSETEETTTEDLMAEIEDQEPYSNNDDPHWLWIIPGIFIMFWRFWLVVALLTGGVAVYQGWISLPL